MVCARSRRFTAQTRSGMGDFDYRTLEPRVAGVHRTGRAPRRPPVFVRNRRIRAGRFRTGRSISRGAAAMAELADSLLARLAGRGGDGSADAWASVVPTVPEHDPPGAKLEPSKNPEQAHGEDAHNPHLDKLLDRIRQISGPGSNDVPDLGDGFLPLEPANLKAARLSEGIAESLILKFLLACANCTGREVSEQIKMPFKIVEQILRDLKHEQLIVYRGTASMNDYDYQLTDMGRERARRYSEQSTYFGSAPVALEDYIASVAAQSITRQHPSVEDLHRAFDDLLLSKRMLRRLGPAINSGRGLFLYGAPGNGKSSIAERVTRAFGQSIWIPRSVGIEGVIIRVFDPACHEELPLERQEGLLDQREIDRRWVRVRRPTIIVGGELTMSNLEVTRNTSTNICEAPLQMKSNCGTLVIDDFGRQRMSTDELLNRWIVPLEKRYDYLNLPNGVKIQVPFDQLIIFSTNLEPKDLVDDAFLRRIPYKIDVGDPSEEEFRELFRIMAPKLGFELHEDVIEYVVQRHFKAVRRPFRCCQPRDLLLQIRNFCLFQKQPLELTEENFDFAVENYFAVM